MYRVLSNIGVVGLYSNILLLVVFERSEKADLPFLLQMVVPVVAVAVVEKTSYDHFPSVKDDNHLDRTCQVWIAGWGALVEALVEALVQDLGFVLVQDLVYHF